MREYLGTERAKQHDKNKQLEEINSEGTGERKKTKKIRR